MGISIGRLRVVLLGSGVLLLLAVTGFVLYAHLRAGFFVRGLPARLGVDIKQETNGFTYSQSSAGKTIFTIHAAKAIQHKDGKITLRDVGIVLYGRDQAGTNTSDTDARADRIYGDDFEYDQNTGEASSAGEVRIDLQAPAAAFKGKPEGGIHQDLPQTGQPDAHVVHVRTHGLVFQQKLGLASSTGEVDFASGGMAGHALGAEYSSQTGIVILQSAVRVSGLLGQADKQRPAVLTAAHAELDRAGNKAIFSGAKYVSPEQGLTADHAIVHTTRDGTPQALETEGHIVVTGNGQGTVTSGRMDAVLNTAGKPVSSHLYDRVQFRYQTSGRNSAATAADATIAFDAEGRASHLLLTGGVTGQQRSEAATRTLSAATLDLSLAGSGPGRSVLRDAKASGAAKVHQVSTSFATKPKGVSTSDLAGDTLLAHFDTADGQPRLSTVDGHGHTLLHQTAADGAEDTSTGDTLSATFGPAGSPSPTGNMEAQLTRNGKLQPPKQSPHRYTGLGPEPSPNPAPSPSELPVELQTVTQRGNVTAVRTSPLKESSAPELQRLSANEATYDAGTDRVILSGKAQVSDRLDTLYAEHVTVKRSSGDALANGNVRVTYLQAAAPGMGASSSPPEPVHILADHAVMQHDAHTAFFYGTPDKPARMWQGTSRIDAPVLQLVQNDKRLIATGESSAPGTAAVHAILLGTPASGPGRKPDGKPPTPVRVAASRMIYTDVTRQVDLNGKVRLDDPDGIVTADQATIYLAPEAVSRAGKPTAPGVQTSGLMDGLIGGQIDRIVATGAVQVTQPDRHATGERLVYTAGTKTFLLTGTKTSPPRLFDQAHGAVVGTSLQFQSGDDRVLVSGGDGSNGPRRVKTDTTVKPH